MILGSNKNREQYEKTVLQESGYCTEQARKISLENDICMSRKGKGKMVQEIGPQTPSPSKWKSSLENKVESACYNTRRRRLELDGASLPCKRRSLMSNETNMANVESKETFNTRQDKKGRDKIGVVGPQTPSPAKGKGVRGPTNDGITQLKSDACRKEPESVYVSNKVEKAYYYTRCVKNLVINELTRGQVVSNRPSRTDTDQRPKRTGQLMDERRVSFKGLKKKKRKIRKVDNVERKATTAWYELLSAVPSDNVDGIWPEVLFIVKVGKVQGPRLYRPWKGSVLDSVLGTLLTQRVGDDTSSSAFMSLSMKFPQDSDCDLYSRHHRILRQKRSNACSNFDSGHKTGNMSNFGKQRRIPFNEMNWRKSKEGKIPEEEGDSDWEKLRKEGGSVRDAAKVDSVDWYAVMRSNVDDVAEAIFVRGMNQKLAIRIKDFLNRLVLDYGNLDLEWLRNIPPQKTKDFLLSIYGIGLKSTECIRLLTLRQPAFPVDVNVARVTVRLGWVPAPSISDAILMRLLEQSSKLHDRIHHYLSQRLSKFDKDTLYQLHCHMITFGKVFCTRQNPNCAECPMRSDCRYYASLANNSSPFVHEKDIEDMGNSRRIVTKAEVTMSIQKEATIYTNPDDSIAPKTPVKFPLPRCQSTRVKKNTSVKARQFGGSKTRTGHFIYELPDLHPFLETFEDRDPDDPSPYLLVTWETDLTKPGETSANKSPSTNCVKGSKTVPGTIMIPCRTALKGNFPLNATHFQANEVFADWQTSQIPFDIPVRTLEGVPRKQLYCGSSLTNIVKGCSANDIRRLFHEGYICTRSFDRKTYATRSLDGRWRKLTITKKTSIKRERC
ncbi:DEMETER-like protein 2 [Silene latifolia]|uniref:DEMETER-like protein 2 n=1 Tax=Silene latifolia TaxID=37657 RepID=UPI003D76F7AE